MHQHLFRFSLAVLLSKMAFLFVVFADGGWPGWVLAAEAVLILAVGATGLVLAWQARRDAQWDGVLPLRREG